MNNALDGSRDAAQKWEHAHREFMFSKGLDAGISTFCVFWHSERNIRLAVRGVDFTKLALRDHFVWFRRMISEKPGVKFRGGMGLGVKYCQITRILNRVVEWMNRGLAHGQTKGMLN